MTEATLSRRAAKPQESVEEIVSQQMEVDKLHRAIAQLPEKQRRRLVLYYFGEFTYEQIADMEGCKHPAVMKSISSALKKLKNFLSGEVTI
ncbi:RNA polymerase sigma factor [Flavonifractor plautii]